MIWYIPDDCQNVRNDDSVLTNLRIFFQALQKHPALHPETCHISRNCGAWGYPTYTCSVLKSPVVMFQVGLKTAICKFGKRAAGLRVERHSNTRQRAKSHPLENNSCIHGRARKAYKCQSCHTNCHGAPQGSWFHAYSPSPKAASAGTEVKKG